MDEVGSMPTSSIKIERGQHIRFTLSVGTTWAGTALTIIDSFSPMNCPVDSSWRYNLRRNACAPLFALVGHVPMASVVMVAALVNALIV